MVGWIILGVFLALLALLLFLPVGVDLGNEGGQFHLSAKVSGLLIQLIPKSEKKPKKEKEEKKKKKKKKEDEEEEDKEPKPKKKRSLPFNRDELLELLKVVLKGLGRFGRAWHVDRFVLHYVAAGSDPYDTAMTYGWVNAALSTLSPLCQRTFKVKNASVWTEVDFTRDKTDLELGLALTITLWRIFGVINRILFGALRILIRSKRRKKREAKALQKEQQAKDTASGTENAAPDAAKPASPTENTEKTNTENIQEEERMAANG